jgi:branched-chain amino acid transport system substrate-binding protein
VPKRLAHVLLPLILAVSLVPQPAASAGVPFDVDVVLSQTGPAAGLGVDETKAFQLAEAAINKAGGIHGTPIHFTIYDDQTNPQVGVELTNQILAHKPALVIGTSLVAGCAAMAPLFANGPVQFCLSSAYAPHTPWTLISGVSLPDFMPPALRYLRERGLTKLAFISTTDASGVQGDEIFDRAMALPENRHLTVVSREKFTATDISIAAQASHIAASGAQAVVLGTAGTSTGTALRGLSDAGVHLPAITVPANMNIDQLSRYEQILPSELLFSADLFLNRATTGRLKGPQDAVYDAFAAKPTPLNVQGWDTAMIVAAMFRQLGTAATPDQVHAYLLNLHDFAGASGIYDFRNGNPSGLNSSDVIVVRWDPKQRYWLPVSGTAGASLRQ